MRRFITKEDVYALAQRGEQELRLEEGAHVTDIAQETADHLGVKLVRGAAVATPAPVQEIPSAKGSRRIPLQGQSRPSVMPGPASKVEGVVPTVTSSPFTDEELHSWRKEFPSLEATIHLANCSQGAQSRTVSAAVDNYMDNWLRAGADWDYWVEEVNAAKAEFARLIGAEPGEVAVVSSVSEAVSTVASALDYTSKRRRVLLTEAEFPTVGHVWLAHQKYGAQVDYVPVRGGKLHLEDYRPRLDDRTALVSVTHVYYQNGFKQDLKAVTDLVHEHGSMILVDAYQGAGTCPLNVKELGVDIFTTGNLKYLLGIPGIAFMYVRPEIIPALHPAATGWFGQQNPFAFRVKELDYAHEARRMEGGTPPVTAAFAARAGMEFINQVGLDRIGQHIDYLSYHCLNEALARNLKVVSPLDVREKGATTAIEVPGDSHAVEVALKARQVVCSARGTVIRVAPHFFNTTGEIDTALDELVAVLKNSAGALA